MKSLINTISFKFDIFCGAAIWILKDSIRTYGSKVYSKLSLALFVLFKCFNSNSQYKYLLSSYRYHPSRYSINQIKHVISSSALDQIEKLIPDDSFDFDEMNKRVIILKNPIDDGDIIEKGVLLITFTATFARFYHHINCEKLLKRYFVILEPSWAGYSDPNILFWSRFKEYPIIIQATESRDYDFIKILDSNLYPVTFGASDWVDNRIFNKVQSVNKQYDLAFIANYNPIKRHHVLFKALKSLREHNVNAVLVLGSWGEGKSAVEKLIKFYGIEDLITIFTDQSQDQVNHILNQSKINTLFSYKEGSNRSIFEGLFAGTPCIILSNNIGINKSYINSDTGFAVEEKDIPAAVLTILENWEKYDTRAWAISNISPEVTTVKLQQTLIGLSQKLNEPWTKGIVVKVNSPELNYYYEKDKHSMPSASEVLSSFLK